MDSCVCTSKKKRRRKKEKHMQPKRCRRCGRMGNIICEPCSQLVHLLTPVAHTVLGNQLDELPVLLAAPRFSFGHEVCLLVPFATMLSQYRRRNGSATSSRSIFPLAGNSDLVLAVPPLPLRSLLFSSRVESRGHFGFDSYLLSHSVRVNLFR